MMGMRCVLFLFSYAVLEAVRGTSSMIPDNQKQLKHRISKAYSELRLEERYRTLRMGKLALFSGCTTSTTIKLLYSGWGKLCI